MANQPLIDALATTRVYDLSVPLYKGMPITAAHPGYMLTLQRRHGDLVRSNGASNANELIIMCAHTGTHIDALGHASIDGRCNGGRNAQAIQVGGSGLRELDAAAIPPLVCRGVMLDIAALKGVDVLEGGYAVTASDLEAAEKRQGVRVQKGDALLIRTGWMKYFEDNHRFVGEQTGTPGPDLSAAHWMVERGVSVTGDETLPYEVARPDLKSREVHPALMVDASIYIIEVMNLEELGRDQVSEFVFVCSPIRFVGGTGSPVRPLALVQR